MFPVYKAEHLCGGSGVVGFGNNLWRAFRVRHDGNTGVILPDSADILRGEAFVNFAGSGVGNNFHSGLCGNVPGKVLVGDHDDTRCVEALDDFDGVAGGAADVAGCLDCC